MWISVGHFEFLNFFLDRWGVQIRNERCHKLANTEFHPNQITFGTSCRHGLGIRLAPGALLALAPPVIYQIYM